MKSHRILAKRLGAFLLASLVTVSLHAQLRTPAASPHAHVKQMVGLTEVEIDYSRPSVKGREIFGGLVPYGNVWRTGANQPTKITFSDDVVLGGESVEAGTYALYTIPAEDEWTIIVYGSTELWGSFGYDSKNDVARFTAKPQKLQTAVESFTIGIDDLRNDSASIYLDWDHTRVAFKLEVPTESKVMTQIDELKGTPEFDKPNVLFSAGTYYHAAGKDLKQAHEWVSEACEKSESPAFWMYAAKARIEVDLGKKKMAKASAEKTLELATEAGNGDYQKIAKDILASL
ncbi:DUF2911 domain-containing protein [Pelagicoccus sp. SDUM812003]|uniref:DUF2911 domain-containing protein n=1 Tax=Pelagicoccus sp. SDUM812003 TaxID=3041267 RepID=UPI00280F5EA9|nr:DUF2911 domain-containing protein [Pelagicoccus sp. SDUM812003]MDQ8203027.1 DUF2911 domain-containing protein [Pelagicoccus sp. SDUM812003]